MSEEMLVRHCAPTLAGLKTGNLFNCAYESKAAMHDEIRRWNRRLSAKGLRVLPLRFTGKNALIYVYRPAKLKKDLANDVAISLLHTHGYPHARPECCIVRLIGRLREQAEFPHEIGLFLGYPPEDVRGFITHNAKCEKCTGCWKVYGDEVGAQKLFAQYKKCTDVYTRRLSSGSTVERLTVAV